jgi:hypothetical protein
VRRSTPEVNPSGGNQGPAQQGRFRQKQAGLSRLYRAGGPKGY